MASQDGLTMIHSNQIDNYRKICSQSTIQSDPKGQFANIINQLREKCNYENALLQVSSIQDNLELVKYVACLEGLTFTPSVLFKAKDEAEATNQRTLGNEAFQKRAYQKAFLHYTVSIIKAEYPSHEDKVSSTTLAFALGNRSACLLNMGHYKEAVTDINLAFSVGYPDDSRYKLYERLGRIYLKMGLLPRAKTSFQIAQQLIAKSETLEDSKKSELKSTMTKLLKDYQNPKPLQQSNGHSNISEDEELKKTCNEYPELSSKAKVSSRPNYGRHILTTEDIAVAETILIEEPYASVLAPERNGFNCSHCFKRLKAAIPCTKCSGVAFCSLSCRDEALATYHKYECSYQDVLSGLGCSQVIRLALRMISQKPFQYFLDLKSEILEIGDDTDIGGDADPYLRCAALVSLNSLRWEEDKLLRAVMALVLVGILRASGYFGEKKATTSGFNTTPNELFIASLLLRNIQILQFNAHEVYEVLRAKETCIKPCKNVAIGLAIYPTASFFNHSCHGNVARFFKGNRLHIKTLHSLKCGEEISENYGPTFYLKTRNFRQNELGGRYWFKCTCKPCSENWPLLENLPTHCSLEPLKGIDELLLQGKVTDSIKELSRIVETYRKVQMPDQLLIRAEDKLRTCISNLGSVTVAEKKPVTK